MSKEEVQKREKEVILYSLSSLRPLYEDKDVTDIWVDNGKVSIKKFGKPREDTDLVMSDQQCKNILVQISNFMGINVDLNSYPVLEGTIPDLDARITGIITKWTKRPFITIRKRPEKIYTIEDYIEKGQIRIEQAEKIKSFIQNKKNILVSGGTGSGKTTFTNAIIKYMSQIFPDDSFYIVEDNAELQCTAKYAEMLNIDTEDAIKVVRLAMRCTPDRIIFGEIRDGKVLWALLDAWNTHPGGVSTIHANSAEGTFLRMRTLLKQSFGTELPVTNLIDMIVHLRKSSRTGVEIDEIIETSDYSDSMLEEIAMRSIEQEL